MMWSLNLILFVWCIWLNVSNSQSRGEIDEKCETDCACCIDKRCEHGQYFRDECTRGCIDGHRGPRCYELCTHNCTECPDRADTCTECYDGYYPGSARDCTSMCLPGCKTCTLGTTCTLCKEEYYNANGYNDCRYRITKCPENCNCDNGQCVSCKSDLYGSTCDNSCSFGCISNTCDIMTGNCACSSNFAGERCDKCITGKYGKLCNQQCPTGCKGSACKKDSGDCTDGCTIDTIVGVKCDLCLTGWYGQYCTISCSLGCKNQQCEKNDGECSYGCLDNFVGRQCNECIPGKYGESCNSDCPNNCDEKGCLKGSGKCISCRVNFDGEKCDRCRHGFYDTLCSERCPINCLNVVCDRDTGTCSDGCLDNYSGDRCCINNNNCMTCLSDIRCKQCKSGYFNDQCDQRCPQNCLKSCHIESGICDGCNGNFYGDSCNFSCASTCNIQTTGGSLCQQSNGKCLYGCVDGFHGLQCSEKCSVYCNDTLCEQDNGKCTNGCKIKVKNDHICPLTPDSSSSEQSVNTAFISLGTILAVSIVVNIIFLVTLILRKYRKRVNDTYKAKGPVYENSGIEMECGNSANPGSAGKHGIVQATKSDPVLKSPDYEDLGRVQVSEHEYGEIRQDT